MPILVPTLLVGFTLVLFDEAKPEVAKQLAFLSFGLEVSASIVLSLISFRGEQLYSHATGLKVLRRTCPVTVFALVEFAIGLITFGLSGGRYGGFGYVDG